MSIFAFKPLAFILLGFLYVSQSIFVQIQTNMIKFLLYTISCAILYNILLCNCNAYTPDITRRHAIKVATLSLSGLPTLAQSVNADTLLLPKATASTTASPTSQLQPSVTIKDGKAVLPKLGTGAWAWGDSLFWGYNPKEVRKGKGIGSITSYPLASGRARCGDHHILSFTP
jgi:hypothetical protein